MNCKRCGEEINTTSVANGLCSNCNHSVQFVMHCFNCNKLQARVEALEDENKAMKMYKSESRTRVENYELQKRVEELEKSLQEICDSRDHIGTLNSELEVRVEELEAENEKMRAHIDEGLGIIEESIEGIPSCKSIIPWLKDYLKRSNEIADAKKEPNP